VRRLLALSVCLLAAAWLLRGRVWSNVCQASAAPAASPAASPIRTARSSQATARAPGRAAPVVSSAAPPAGLPPRPGAYSVVEVPGTPAPGGVSYYHLTMPGE
jgi:hypothetical protein